MRAIRIHLCTRCSGSRLAAGIQYRVYREQERCHLIVLCTYRGKTKKKRHDVVRYSTESLPPPPRHLVEKVKEQRKKSPTLCTRTYGRLVRIVSHVNVLDLCVIRRHSPYSAHVVRFSTEMCPSSLVCSQESSKKEKSTPPPPPPPFPSLCAMERIVGQSTSFYF